MANSLRGGGPTFGNIAPVSTPSLGGLQASSTIGAGRFVTQGGVPIPPNPVIAFLRGGGALESVARPFADPKAFALLDRILARRLKPGEEAEASLRWGAASRWSLKENIAPEQPEHIGVGVIVGDSDPPETPPGDPVSQITYEETGRVTHVLRVTNPADDEQYVDVEVIDQISFMGPDNITRTFILHNEQ